MNKKRATMQVSELRDWARKMGYQGEIPDDFELLNESTEHIWRQVVDRIKPKNEVQQIKNNILMARLKSQQADTAHVSNAVLNCPNNEYDMWKKKQELQKKLTEKRRQVDEAREKLAKIEHNTHFIHTQTKVSEWKIKEAECKHFLYEAKAKKLSLNINTAQQKLKYLNGTISMLEADGKQAVLAQNLEKLALNKDAALTREKLEEIYAANDREYLFEVINHLSNSRADEIIAACEEEYSATQTTKEAIKQRQADHLIKLHTIHVEVTLDNIVLEKNNASLKLKLQQLKKEVISKYPQAEAEIETSLAALECEARNSYYIDCLTKPKMLQSSVVDLSVKPSPISKRVLNQSRRELKNKVGVIQAKYDNYKQNSLKIRHKHANVYQNLVSVDRMTSVFTSTEGLLAPLAANVATAEIQALDDFCLEYNRSMWHSRENVYYRDTCDTLLPFATCGDDDILRRVCRAFGMRTLDAERVVDYYRWRVGHHIKLREFLERDNGFVFSGSVANYHLNDLQRSDILQDDSVMKAVKSMSRPLPLWSAMDRRGFHRAAQLFVEMPFDAYVPKTLQYKGKSYDEYWQLFYESYLIL